MQVVGFFSSLSLSQSVNSMSPKLKAKGAVRTTPGKKKKIDFLKFKGMAENENSLWAPIRRLE